MALQRGTILALSSSSLAPSKEGTSRAQRGRVRSRRGGSTRAHRGVNPLTINEPVVILRSSHLHMPSGTIA